MARPVAAIAHVAGASGSDLLDSAMALSRFRRIASRRIAAALKTRGACTAIVAPALDGFAPGSPAAADPLLVEQLLDRLFDLGVTEAALGATPATASLWVENRAVFAAADLLGYRYETPGGRPYDVIDLAEDLKLDVFGPAGALAGTGLSKAWLEADLRIVFAANRTDEDDGYGLCLTTLLGVLPLTDKDYHYRARRDPGAVVLELLRVAPAHFAFIDAVVSSHGVGGARAPRAIATDTVIAASDPALADYLGALKMGLDPFVSGLAGPSLRLARPTSDTRIVGSLEAYRGWINVDPASIAATAARRQSLTGDRLVRPILQQVDRDIFPFREPANAWLNRTLAGGPSDAGLSAPLVTLLNLWLGEIGKAGDAWAVMFNKDALRRSEAPVDIDAVGEEAYAALAAELGAQSELLRGLPADAEGMRWRFDDGAVIFDGARRIAQPYERFVAAVEIHRAIQFMNDYIGGQTLVTGRDAEGRVTRQIERNLYLPQPNYTALGGGVTIDVTKIEAVDYTARRQRMIWKTLKSHNQSALADDGVVTFEALGDDTLVTISGRQHFRLPPLWEAIDRSLTPEAKSALVSDAYSRFFRRTFANLEAVSEGRDVRIGKSWSDDTEGEPLPIERLSGLFRHIQASGALDVQGLLNGALGSGGRTVPAPVTIDADGFHHFPGPGPSRPAEQPRPSFVAEILRDLSHAARVDAGAAS